MIMTIENKRRELFEAWVDGQGWPQKHTMRHELYLAFNAALDAVVIQCPTTYSREYNRSERSYNEGVSDFKEAVDSVGLGIKVIIQ